MIKKLLLFILPVSLFLTSCKEDKQEGANELLAQAQTLIDNGAWDQALIIIDSIHNTYPRLVAQRRLAKNLSDSITYLEAQKNLAHADTILPPLLQEVDQLLKNFKYEKNNKYEDEGRYIPKNLITDNNSSRNFIQAYVTDQRHTAVKSYYFGSVQANQYCITLKANGEEQTFTGSNHVFNSEGYHEMLSLDEEQALAFLSFVSTHQNAKITVVGKGKKNHSWAYNLSDNEKRSLAKTYQLGCVMKDIKQAEQLQLNANRIIMHYIEKQAK
jgi:hypothetical protein